MAQVKWGIIGLGNIALKFSEGFQYTKNAKLFAISSRSKNKLQAFKNKFQIDELKERLEKEEKNSVIVTD